MAKYYRVVIYDGGTLDFMESRFVYELEDAINLLKTKCNDIIDDFAYDGIRMKATMLGSNDGICIFDVNDTWNNHYMVSLKEVTND